MYILYFVDDRKDDRHYGRGRRSSLDDEEDEESTPIGAGVVGAAHSNSSVDKMPSDHGRQNVGFKLVHGYHFCS